MKWRQYGFFVDSLALHRSGDCDCSCHAAAKPGQKKAGRRVEDIKILLKISIFSDEPLENAYFAAAGREIAKQALKTTGFQSLP